LFSLLAFAAPGPPSLLWRWNRAPPPPLSLQRVIYIQNLPTHATDGDLRSCFGAYGRVYKGMALQVRESDPRPPARPPAR
jgi:hypothetical protein